MKCVCVLVYVDIDMHIVFHHSQTYIMLTCRFKLHFSYNVFICFHAAVEEKLETSTEQTFCKNSKLNNKTEIDRLMPSAAEALPHLNMQPESGNSEQSGPSGNSLRKMPTSCGNSHCRTSENNPHSAMTGETQTDITRSKSHANKNSGS